MLALHQLFQLFQLVIEEDHDEQALCVSDSRSKPLPACSPVLQATASSGAAAELSLPPRPPVTVLSHDCAHMTSTLSDSTWLYVFVLQGCSSQQWLD